MSALDTSLPGSAERHDAAGLAATEIVPMVESILRAALDRIDAEAAAARAEAGARVAAAVRRSAELARAHARGVLQPLPDLGPSRLPARDGEDLGPGVVEQTTAQVYDLFWADMPVDWPIRERLRRWAQRPLP